MTARPNIVPSDTLLALAERCEKATGPDRDLDAEVEVALQKWPEGWTQFNESATITWAAFQDSRGEQRVRLNANGIGYASWAAPHYTASLDAALTLVPEGWRLAALCEREPWFCRLETLDFDSVTWGKGNDWITNVTAGQDTTAQAATPALALVSAALRARAAQ